MTKKENEKIIYIDKMGRKWDKKCLDELFDAITERKKVERRIDYYAMDEG